MYNEEESQQRWQKAADYTPAQYSRFKKEYKEFIEEFPLYKSRTLELPPLKRYFEIEVAQVYCSFCKSIQAHRQPIPTIQQIVYSGVHKRPKTEDYLTTDVYPIKLQCQGCLRGFFQCWVWVKVEANSVSKMGQKPAWFPRIPKEIKEELGSDAPLYLKALRNMQEGYGIGACAYFRRLIEEYINPMLELLCAMKQESGASEEEISRIRDAIQSKDFTRKTAFAAEIAPASIMVGGMNPLKKLHDLLSESIHVHDEDKAMDIAMQLQKTVEFVIRQLRVNNPHRKRWGIKNLFRKIPRAKRVCCGNEGIE